MCGVGAATAHAASPYWYTSVFREYPSELIIKWAGIEEERYLSCKAVPANTATDMSLTTSTVGCTYIGATSTPILEREERLAAEAAARGQVGGKSVSSATPSPRPVTSTVITQKKVSPDGRFVAYYGSQNDNKGKRIFGVYDTVRKARYERSAPVKSWDLLQEAVRLFSFTPDSKTLIYMDDRDGSPMLYTVSLQALATKGKTALAGKRLSTKGYTVADFIVTDADTLFFTANRTVTARFDLYRYSLKSETLALVAQDVSYAMSLRLFAGSLLYARQTEYGSVLAGYSLATKKAADIVTPSTGLISFTRGQQSLFTGLKTSQVSVGTLSSKTQVYVMESAAQAAAKVNKERPLILWLHGGPFRMTVPGFNPYKGYAPYDWSLAELARSGALVAKVNYPGSFGFGTKFANSVQGHVGSADVAYLQDVLKVLARAYSYKQVYVVGNSYGGYLALRSLVAYPKQYAGAISVNGVSDWGTLMAEIDSPFLVHFGGTPNKSSTRAAYQMASVFDRVQRLTHDDPILLMHSRNDATVPVRQSVNAQQFFEQNNVNSHLVFFDDEDHALARRESITLLCKKMAEFIGISNALVPGVDSTFRCEL
jgi:dipeptidyl aminopeptidase/acylaminoacyl peptidase